MRLRSDLLMLCAMIGMMTTPLYATAEQKRIEPGRVTVKNHEQFVAQLKRELPVGTSIEDVRTYLSDNKISYSYISLERYPYYTPEIRADHFIFMLRKISNVFFVFRTDLQVNIYISKKEKVLEIKHELIHTAF